MRILFITAVVLLVSAELYLSPSNANPIGVETLREWPELYEGREPRLINAVQKLPNCESAKQLRELTEGHQMATVVINGCQRTKYWQSIGIRRCIDRQYYMLDKLGELCLTVPELGAVINSGLTLQDGKPVAIDMLEVYRHVGDLDIEPEVFPWEK
ncbi:MAG: hypothetical protein IBX56_19605 [Methylomicrobium sp.]|nr:hypothetical protein [Methylomicrobium sp.]